jgi:hypothetical protein
MTLDEAAAAFARRDAGLLGRLRRRPLRSIALAFVPYHLFRVRIEDGTRLQSAAFAVDAVDGTLDPYSFGEDLRAIDMEPLASGNRIPASLTADAAWPLLQDRLRRMVFQTGFFRLRDPRLSAEREAIALHVPYWIGFREDGQSVGLDVIDAVRGRLEGAKARALVESWLIRTTAGGPPASSEPCPGTTRAKTACR